jgi:hypothetical protein
MAESNKTPEIPKENLQHPNIHHNSGGVLICFFFFIFWFAVYRTEPNTLIPHDLVHRRVGHFAEFSPMPYPEYVGVPNLPKYQEIRFSSIKSRFFRLSQNIVFKFSIFSSRKFKFSNLFRIDNAFFPPSSGYGFTLERRFSVRTESHMAFWEHWVFFRPHYLNSESTNQTFSRRFTDIYDLHRNFKGFSSKEYEAPILRVMRVTVFWWLTSQFEFEPWPLIHLQGSSLLGQLILQDTKLDSCSDCGDGRVLFLLFQRCGQNTCLFGHFRELVMNVFGSNAGGDQSKKCDENSYLPPATSNPFEFAKSIIFRNMNKQRLLAYLYFCGGMLLCLLCGEFTFGGSWYNHMDGLYRRWSGRSFSDGERVLLSCGIFLVAVRLGFQAVINVSQ